MPDNRSVIKKMVCITAGIWLISLLVFLSACGRWRGEIVWPGALYGVWNLLLFTGAYLRIQKRTDFVMTRVSAQIQRLIDGSPKAEFSMAEDTVLGKFQVQVLRLYEILNSAKEEEIRMRKEMSETVADLVHQVNTPLANIQMYSGFLIQDDLPKEERERISGIIEAQVEKLGWFADGFAKTARLEEDIMQINPQPQQILPMVLGAIDQVSLKAQQNGMEILLEGRQDITAIHDRRWTEEALFNILDNAVKYGHRETEITVRMTAYELFVRIDVENYGEPIAKDRYNQLFQRFWRGENAAFVKEGVGLGLYLTRKILLQQGGYVKVGDYHGRGNVFSIFLKKG